MTISQAQCRQQPPPATDPISSPRRGGGLRWGGKAISLPPDQQAITCTSDIPSDRPVDVIVLGGGPAGTATAIALARLGWSVTILERSHYESARIGETLPPDIKHPLIALGVWDRFLADNPLESPGISSAWGQAELYDNGFIVNPHGPGWHVDRRCFDAMLARATEELGVEVMRGARGISVKREAPIEPASAFSPEGRIWEGEAPTELATARAVADTGSVRPWPDSGRASLGSTELVEVRASRLPREPWSIQARTEPRPPTSAHVASPTRHPANWHVTTFIDGQPHRTPGSHHRRRRRPLRIADPAPRRPSDRLRQTRRSCVRCHSKWNSARRRRMLTISIFKEQ